MARMGFDHGACGGHLMGVKEGCVAAAVFFLLGYFQRQCRRHPHLFIGQKGDFFGAVQGIHQCGQNGADPEVLLIVAVALIAVGFDAEIFPELEFEKTDLFGLHFPNVDCQQIGRFFFAEKSADAVFFFGPLQYRPAAEGEVVDVEEGGIEEGARKPFLVVSGREQAVQHSPDPADFLDRLMGNVNGKCHCVS